MTEATTNQDQGLIKPEVYNSANATTNDSLNASTNNYRVQAQQYGQKFQDAAGKAKDFASDKFAVASDKFKELQGKDPKEIVSDAKEYARQKPGQALLISAAVGLVLGILLKRR